MTTKDGCDCPVNVLRCVHYPGGDRLILATGIEPYDGHDAGCSMISNYEFQYCVWKERIVGVEPCPDCGKPMGYVSNLWDYNTIIEYYDGDSLEDALAAFYAAEEALLTRLAS